MHNSMINNKTVDVVLSPISDKVTISKRTSIEPAFNDSFCLEQSITQVVYI